MSYVKQCSKCNEIKEINEFYKKVSSKDGYTGVCKKCITENNKKYKASIELSDELPFKKGGDKLDISYASEEDITIINKIN